MIFHITTPAQWQKFKNQEHYFPETFEAEGFIHCSTSDQLAGVLERYYKGATNLLKLHIDESKLSRRLLYEKAANNEFFPHVFGGINKDAIVEVELLKEV